MCRRERQGKRETGRERDRLWFRKKLAAVSIPLCLLPPTPGLLDLLLPRLRGVVFFLLQIVRFGGYCFKLYQVFPGTSLSLTHGNKMCKSTTVKSSLLGAKCSRSQFYSISLDRDFVSLDSLIEVRARWSELGFQGRRDVTDGSHRV